MKASTKLRLFITAFVFSATTINVHAASILAGNTSYDLKIRTGTSCARPVFVTSCSGFTSFFDHGHNPHSDNNGVTLGTAIGGDGLAGIIRFTTDATGNNFVVDTFNQDGQEYIPAAGFWSIYATNPEQMTGTIDAFGNMTFKPVSRTAIIGGFEFLGTHNLIFDDYIEPDITDAPNDWVPLITGTMTRDDRQFPGTRFSISGTPFTTDGSGGFNGKLVSIGYWGNDSLVISGAAYTEIWDVNITPAAVSAVPVPAAIWLFGSGLIALIGVSRKRG